MPDDYWSRSTRDAWFFGFLAFSTLSVAWLFWPYVYVLLFAAVTVVVSWPIYTWLRDRLGGRSMLASVLTSVGLALVVFLPLAWLAYLFGREVEAVVRQTTTWIRSGDAEAWLDERLTDAYAQPWVASLNDSGVLESVDLAGVVSSVQNTLLSVVQAAGSTLPGLVTTAVDVSIDAIIFVFAVVTLYIEGPRVGRVLKNLSPLDDDYEDRLFGVFREFSLNLVVGSLATAALQGLVAGVGFWIAGLDKVVFLGILTAVLSFVPVIGTTTVWLPVALVVGLSGSWGVALFIAAWSIAFTGTVDNVLRPLLMRGSTDIHALLVFLAVFGGMYWMGVAGILIGPVIVAFFLALYTIYVEDYLGVPPPPPPEPGSGWTAKLLRRLEGALGLRAGEAGPDGPSVADGQGDEGAPQARDPAGEASDVPADAPGGSPPTAS